MPGRAVDEAIETDRDPRAAPVDLVVSPGDRTRWARGAAVAAVQDFVAR